MTRLDYIKQRQELKEEAKVEYYECLDRAESLSGKAMLDELRKAAEISEKNKIEHLIEGEINEIR